MIVQQIFVSWWAPGVITVADGKWSWKAPYAGEIISIGGYIQTLGAGAGTSTDIQLRNQTQAKDILSTVGAFEVDSATNLLEGQVVNPTNATFAAGDVIDLDCDAVSTNPATAQVWAIVSLFLDDV